MRGFRDARCASSACGRGNSRLERTEKIMCIKPPELHVGISRVSALTNRAVDGYWEATIV